ncbi:MAG: ATP-dependent DNA ligase [Candidatus Aenigmarchaeota archaeon]|nr:ATP-dependent DNA ligase [Candidatus Aenigmarchaeota archaeon]
MKYSELSDAYELLESTPSKLAKTDIVANLFNAAGESLQQVVMLSNGRVFPDYEQIELGIANQLVIKSISKATGIPQKEVEKKFTTSGDLGIVVEHFVSRKKQSTLGNEILTVEKVFTVIQELARQTGKGSQDRKMSLISSLITAAKPKEARYIIRTLLQQLRVGIAEGVIRNAIAKAFDVNPQSVERAWNMKSDFSEIALIAKKQGEKGLEKIKLEIGKSVQVLLAEKSPDLKTALESFENAAIEWKMDGMRCQIHKQGDKVLIFTRRLENVTHQFPDMVKMVKKCVKTKECIIEGETIAVDKKTRRPLPFQVLSQRIQRKHEIERMVSEIPVQVNLFDVVYVDGEQLFEKPLHERRKILEKIIKPDENFRIIEQLVTKDLKKAEKFYKDALNANQEGLMVKNLDAIYIPGRNVAGGWLKVKPTMENLDLVIVGATWGNGKRSGWLTSFVLAVRDPDTNKFLECGMMSTGIKEKKEDETDVTYNSMTKMLKPLIEKEAGGIVRIKPKIVIEVACEEIQKSRTYSSGFGLRFPRFIRIRNEKSERESETMERLNTLYEMQKK